MKKTKIILLVIIVIVVVIFAYGFLMPKKDLCWPYCPNMTDEDRSRIKEEMRIAGCPDEKIVDKMPSIIDDTGVIPSPKAYYIKDGKRVEISEYDPIWISANCEIPVTEVE